MYKLITVSEGTIRFISLGMPLHSIIYTCWSHPVSVNRHTMAAVGHHDLIAPEVWLKRRTIRTNLGWQSGGNDLTSVEKECLEFLDSLPLSGISTIFPAPGSEIFHGILDSLKHEISIGSHSLLFLFTSNISSRFQPRQNWIEIGYIAQHLCVIAAKHNLDSFPSHGSSYNKTIPPDGMLLEYVLVIGKGNAHETT